MFISYLVLSAVLVEITNTSEFFCTLQVYFIYNIAEFQLPGYIHTMAYLINSSSYAQREHRELESPFHNRE